MLINPVSIRVSRHVIQAAIIALDSEIHALESKWRKAKSYQASGEIKAEIESRENAKAQLQDALAIAERPPERMPSLSDLYAERETEMKSESADNRRPTQSMDDIAREARDSRFYRR